MPPLSIPDLPPIERLDVLWWLALLIQLVAIPGTVLPVLPGLALLPLGAGLWCWAVGWSAGWPALALALVLMVLGWGADALGVVLGAARLQATRWAYVGAAIGLGLGVLGLLPALPVGGPLLGAVVGPLLGAVLGEFVSASTALGPLGLLRLRRSLLVGLAVVAGLLVSTAAQLLLAIVGVLGFVALTSSSWR
ncbi:MAG: DUF456 family protein [Cyanobacteriota bacterium]|jgi:uncharacterized protein YqgC (DUF456 family)|nr:DUF456 family protein [Cyanobacteriota bacterium]